jgi:hypothetical protein
MRRTILALSIAVLLASLAACADRGPGAGGGEPGSTSSGLDERRLSIYEAAIRSQIEFRDEKVWIFDRICTDAEGPGDGDGECPDAFSPAEQDALLRALADMPSVRFVEDTEALTQRIFDGKEHGQIVRVGPIVEGDGRVELAASHYCGGLCGGGSVWLVERDEDGWMVTGPVPGHGVWVS